MKKSTMYTCENVEPPLNPKQPVVCTNKAEELNKVAGVEISEDSLIADL
jgi:hypothetical protein